MNGILFCPRKWVLNLRSASSISRIDLLNAGDRIVVTSSAQSYPRDPHSGGLGWQSGDLTRSFVKNRSFPLCMKEELSFSLRELKVLHSIIKKSTSKGDLGLWKLSGEELLFHLPGLGSNSSVHLDMT